MKKDIHPEIKKIQISCATCETKYEMSSTSKEIKVDVCASCHPFFTGKMSTGSKDGQIEKFNRKFKATDK